MVDFLEDLKLQSYNYLLPEEFVAHRPAESRHDSRLLVYNIKTELVTHAKFIELDKFLPKESTLVLNKSRVFPCRLLGQKRSGGKAEIFLLDIHPFDKKYPNCFPALIKTSHKKNVGDVFIFKGKSHSDIIEATIEAVLENGTFLISFSRELQSIIDSIGQIPIPSYIRGGIADEQDFETYQTIYATVPGSVAAPTAGLHFSQEVFSRLTQKQIELAFVTLHVGVGTFAPVKNEIITDHKMHKERYFVESEDLRKIVSAKKIIAVGTTSVRTLESSFDQTVQKISLNANQTYETNIFIHPGYQFKTIDGLITNFHLPKSSLLMLVSALVGRKKTLELYELAKNEGYRFFSYGDAMLILR